MGTTATVLEDIARQTDPAPPDRRARGAEALLRLCGVDQILQDATVDLHGGPLNGLPSPRARRG